MAQIDWIFYFGGLGRGFLAPGFLAPEALVDLKLSHRTREAEGGRREAGAGEAEGEKRSAASEALGEKRSGGGRKGAALVVWESFSSTGAGGDYSGRSRSQASIRRRAMEGGVAKGGTESRRKKPPAVSSPSAKRTSPLRQRAVKAIIIWWGKGQLWLPK